MHIHGRVLTPPRVDTVQAIFYCTYQKNVCGKYHTFLFFRADFCPGYRKTPGGGRCLQHFEAENVSFVSSGFGEYGCLRGLHRALACMP